MAPPLLAIDDLRVEFATPRGMLRAVDSISLTIARGEVRGLVGESGSGKSTVALSILRLLGPGGRVSSGAIRFADQDLLRLPESRLRELRGNRIAIVFQDPLTSLTPSLRIGEQLAETIVTHRRVSRAEAWRQSVQLLDQVGIGDAAARARQFPHQFSGGMRQRVSLALALSCSPDLLILDEPTTALDVTIQAQILDLIEELRDQLSLSVLFITHDLGVIVRICDSVSVLYGGRLVEDGPLETLFQQPLHPYTKGLLASVPTLASDRRGKRLPSISGRVPDLVDAPSGCIFATRCPFLETRCHDPQRLAPAGERRLVACWKADRLSSAPWPLQLPHGGAEQPTTAATTTDSALTVQDVTRDYTLTGFWDSLRVERSGAGLPRLVARPTRLRAVDDVSLTIAPRETLGLVGESGCGKTTLGRAIVGLVQPSAGQVRLDGRAPAAMSREELRRYRKDVQIIFQNPDSSLNPRMTIRQILARPLELYGLADGRQVDRRVSSLLDIVQLSPAHARRYPHQLSGGEKQRVGIARALAAEPRFIICDEPISALDVSVRASILNLLQDLKEQFGLGYLFIAHDLAVVRHISDRIAVMYRGRIVELGTVDEIFAPPYHPYTQALLSAIPLVDYAERNRRRIHLEGGVVARAPGAPGCNFADRCQWKIGPVCDEVTPPDRQIGPERWIHCHHDLEFLNSLDPMLAPGEVDVSV
jgi:oligopeptide/dipeptide ABC transporter ATP-binding protein